MDWDRVEGNWKQMKGRIKEQWGKLTDDDLDVIDGRRDQLRARSRKVTAIRRIAPVKTWTTGTTDRPGEQPYASQLRNALATIGD